MVCAHVVLIGELFPVASSEQWFWMGLSGIVGIGIGDSAVFAAYLAIGPKRSLLLQLLSPIFASAGAYLMLGETFSLLSILGIAVTLTGIIVVLLESEVKPEEKQVEKKRKTWGLFFALIAAMATGFGIVLSKKGMYYDASVVMNPASAALIQMMLAVPFVWMCTLFAGRLPELRAVVKDRVGIKYTILGTLIGAFAGMMLCMVAVANAPAGIAQTLMSLAPILIIPVARIVYKNKIGWRGVFGAIVSLIGVAILFLT
jgi:drug/metabolite transporter (DMT)-like permease